MTSNPKNLTPTMKAVQDLVPGDLVVVSHSVATYVSKPELVGQALPVAEFTDHQDGTFSLRLEGLQSIGCRPEQEVEVRLTVETPGVFSERARVVASVPKSATFEFGYDRHSFFTVKGELVAVAR